MKDVLDIRSIIVDGDIDQRLGKYAYGVFLVHDMDGSTFIAVKYRDKVEKIRLEGENEELIKGLYDESTARIEQKKDMEELKNLILCVSKRTEKMDEFLVSVTKKFDAALAQVIERYIRETWHSVVEMKKQKDEAKEKDPLPEDSFKGFISESSLERIIREIVSSKDNDL